jgi:hypothetical protein
MNLEMTDNILFSRLQFQTALLLLGVPLIENWEQIGNRIPQNIIEQHVS